MTANATMQRVCRTCRWWGSDPDTLPQFPGRELHRACECPKVGGGSYGDESRMGPDAANSYETIGTGPEFGCIHWQEMWP